MSEAERENSGSGTLSKFELGVIELIMNRPESVFDKKQYLQDNRYISSVGN